MSTVAIAVITGLVIAISASIQHFFSLFDIIFKKQLPPKGAVEIDPNEHIYAHPDCITQLQDHRSFGVTTAYEAILHGSKISPNRPALSFRKSSDEPFQSYTHKEMLDIIKEIGSGMINLGLQPSNQTFVGIYATTSVNYTLCLYSTWPYSMVPFGIYDSLGQDGVKFILKQADGHLIFADNLQRVRNLLEWKGAESSLKIVVSFVDPTDELIKLAEEKQITLLTLEKVREIGRSNPIEFVPPKSSDAAVIMYTSGSTGEPKGCVMIHDTFICAILGLMTAVHLMDKLKTKEIPRVLAYLPLAHIFGCGTIVGFTFLGGELGFWQGQVDKLLDDCRDFRPTELPMVPRLLNKLYDKVRLELRKKGIFSRMLFRLAISAKLALLRRGIFSQNTIWDKLIFNKIRQAFGGQLKGVLVTSAPLSIPVCNFSRATFSCLFLECYGQTECILGCSQTKNYMEPGTAGIPTTMNYIKLVDVPEKEYFAKNGVGEICIKSPALFNGYLKDEAKTREAVDEQGWLHTGDIGRWTPYNTMKIVDRKKNMYKLSQGEYVAPEKIEDVYARSRFLSQVFVYGDSFEHYLIALVVLDDDYVKKWSTSQGYDAQKIGSSEWREKLKEVILNDMIQEGKRRGLMSYEQVKAIEIIPEAFTIENGLLTPTFKSRRYAVEKKYKELFEKIYKKTKV